MGLKPSLSLSVILCTIVVFSGPVLGVPADRKVWTFRQPDGTLFQGILQGDEHCGYYRTLEGDIIRQERSSGEWRYARPRRDALEITSIPVGRDGLREQIPDRQMTEWLAAAGEAADRMASRILDAPGAPQAVGTLRGVLLLANFSDTVTRFAASDFNDLMNATGYNRNGALGSVKDYYLEASYGQLTLRIDVYGWFSLPKDRAYYGRNVLETNKDDDDRKKEMIVDAIAAADANVNFAVYDQDKDGRVDLFGVLHQGQGEDQSGADSDCIWSHMDFLPEPKQADGVRIWSYYTVPERYHDRLTTIGVACHEIGHILRVPDLYDVDGTSNGVGNWSLMGSGSWRGPQGNGEKPCHFDPWCKYVLGWVTPKVISGPQTGVALPAFDTDPTVLLIPVDPYQDGEYFLVANRYARATASAATGFDQYLAGSGALILHVDDYVRDNDTEARKKVDVEEADGKRDLDEDKNSGDSGDLYPNGGPAFADFSEPDSRDSDGVSTGITISSFTGAGTDTMTCDVIPQGLLNGYAILYDSLGPWGDYRRGYGDGDDYACVRFQTDQGGILERVKTLFVYEGRTDYTVNVYSGWSNNVPTGLMTTQTGVHMGKGYEEIVLARPQTFRKGSEFSVEIRYNTGGDEKWPLPMVYDGDCSGRSYARSSSSNGYYRYTQANGAPYDACIRADLRPSGLAPLTFRLNATVSAAGGGSLTRNPDKALYNHGETVTLEALPAAGRRFTGWSGDLVSRRNPVTIRMDSDKILIAGFMGDYQSYDVPRDIPDKGTMVSVLTIAEAGKIADLDVRLDIIHPYDGDLDVFLIAPDGIRVELFTDQGGSGDGFSNTVLDDEAPVAISAGSAPFSDRYKPEGSLGVLRGKDMKGTWKLEITDDSNSDVGRLNSWALIIQTAALQ